MLIAIVATIVVVALLAGLILNLRSSSKTGMPSGDVLSRATERARKLDAQERAGQDDSPQ